MPTIPSFSLPPSEKEVEVFAKSLRPEHLHCRTWGHDPQPHNIRVAKNIEGHPDAYWDVDLLCSHGCGVKWSVLAAKDGGIIRRTITYTEAPGYLSDIGRIDKDGRRVIRRAFLVGHSKRSR